MSGKKNQPADAAEQLRRNADAARQDLGATAQEASDRARKAVDQVAGSASEQAAKAVDQAKALAQQAVGQAGKVADQLPDPVRQQAEQTARLLRQRPALIVAALAGMLAMLVAVRVLGGRGR